MNPDPASLDRVHDILLPAPAPWWPPAPAWYWLIGAAIIFGVVWTFRLIARHQANRYRREALAELAKLRPRADQPDQRAQAVADLAVLLKRVALSGFPRERVAGLTGAPWQEFLESTSGRRSLSRKTSGWIEDVAFDPRAAERGGDAGISDAFQEASAWIAHHQNERIAKGDA